MTGVTDDAEPTTCSYCQQRNHDANHAGADCPYAELHRFKQGGSFILDTSPDPMPLWGYGSDVLWAEGESLIIVGGQGTGKTTLAQQLALGRAGIPELDTLLGYPIQPDGRVLYLAMDRPRQIARSFRRMVGDAWRRELDAHLVFWEGPPLFDMAADTTLLTRMADVTDARTIVVDSIKDAAIGLSDDEVGAGWNRARQHCLRAGVELIELHHQRKAPNGGRTHVGLDDVYGSTWITSGAGSVLMLIGAPGDPIIKAHHIKQPSSEIGPLQLVHNHEDGHTSVWHAADLVAVATANPAGITAVEAACALFDTSKPTRNDKEKARRKLDALTKRGDLVLIDKGDPAANRPARWGSL